ncbi:hypothetical protein ASPNIDRAFT_36391 [Aspergillus niger ATCC 1015]|uniref:Uncharacterized protein n=1 Tax=Aspergillus niger (strain ATCC 1015 / CBS 113.46 / FGSC A1144 / LSHB Ac4 / NCTC 3858a / NRRL 328 / USDA 3528.7) TaxID=380704 RepID=G3XQT7_ASPNA|nr:hypothetical protein ASPNIDRAFT_36391 [Aspergillus niger ATCC 1015]
METPQKDILSRNLAPANVGSEEERVRRWVEETSGDSAYITQSLTGNWELKVMGPRTASNSSQNCMHTASTTNGGAMYGMNSSLKSAYRDCRANASRIVAYETYYRDRQIGTAILKTSHVLRQERVSANPRRTDQILPSRVRKLGPSSCLKDEPCLLYGSPGVEMGYPVQALQLMLSAI